MDTVAELLKDEISLEFVTFKSGVGDASPGAENIVNIIGISVDGVGPAVVKLDCFGEKFCVFIKLCKFKSISIN